VIFNRQTSKTEIQPTLSKQTLAPYLNRQHHRGLFLALFYSYGASPLRLTPVHSRQIPVGAWGTEIGPHPFKRQAWKIPDRSSSPRPAFCPIGAANSSLQPPPGNALEYEAAQRGEFISA
jgi:hypothetical protein